MSGHQYSFSPYPNTKTGPNRPPPPKKEPKNGPKIRPTLWTIAEEIFKNYIFCPKTNILDLSPTPN